MSLLNFDPNQYRTQSPTQQSQTSQQQGRFADSVDMFQAGAASGLGGIFDFFGADGIAKSLYGISDNQFGQLSDRGREAMSKPMFEFNELGEVALGEGMTDLDSWILNMANMAGQLAPTMIPGAGAAGLAVKGLSLGARGAKVAQAVGMGFTGGAAATGQAMEQGKRTFREMPAEEKAKSPMFVRKFLEIDAANPTKTDQEKWDMTDAALEQKIGDEIRSDPIQLLANFGTSAIGDPILGRALTGMRLVKSGAFRSAVAGGIAEGANEGIQAAASQYSVDKALSQIDNRDPTANVKLAALNEGILGAGVGGVAGFGGGLRNRKPKPEVKNDAADPIREDSPGLASAMDSLAGESAARQIDMAEIAATQTPASPAIDYDQPAAARQAGMGGTMEAGKLGDDMLAKDNQYRTTRVGPHLGEGDSGVTPYTRPQGGQVNRGPLVGELLTPVSQRTAGYLGRGQQFDAESVERARTREAMASQPTNLIGKSSTIFADDGRPSQQRRESIEQQRRKVERESAARPLAIEDKGIVFSGNQSGVNVMSSGRPFKTAKEALASKGARIAKREGATVQAVKFGDGWGWEDSRQSQPQQTEQIQQAPDLTPQALPKAADMTVDQLDKEWVAFKPETGTLNIPRAKMPQIKAEHRGAMVNFMNARGVEHVSEEVPADSLKPTQAEFSPAKVKKALGYDGGDRSILISSDNYVLDGHHQWLTKQEKGEPIKVIRLKAPIGELVDLAHEFPSSQTEAQQAAEQDADQAATKEEAVSPEPVTATPAAPEAMAQPAQLELPVTEPIQSKAPADSDTPAILRTTKAKWRQSELKRLGIKKGSPGYAEALAKVDDNYEAEIDKALAQSPFEVYQEFNSDTPESINRRAYEELRKEFAVDDVAPSKDEAAKAQGESEKAPQNDTEPDGELYYSKTGRSEAAMLAKSIRDDYDGLKLSLSERDGIVTLSNITVPQELREQGIGTEVMSRVIEWADANGKTLALTPSSDFGGKVSRLKEFYSRLGFVPNRGKGKDFAISESMYRLPNGAEPVFSKNSRGVNRGSRKFSQADAQRAVDDVMKRLSGAAGIRVNLFTSQEEFLERFNVPAMAQQGQTIYGAYDDRRNSAYLILDNFASIDDLRSTLVHEVLAHGGLHTVIGQAKYQEFVKKLTSTRARAELKDLWARIDKDYKGASESVKAEEVFANFVQNQPERGSLKAWWFELKRWLRRQFEGLGILRTNNARNEMEDMVKAIVRGFDKRKARMDRAQSVLDKRETAPDQIQFDKAEEDLLFNMAVEEDNRTAKQKLGLEEQAVESISDKIKGKYRDTADTLKDSAFWNRLKEGIFDGLHGIKQAEEAAGITDPNKMGYVSARLASGLADVLHGVFHYGAPEWRDGIIQRKEGTKGLLEVLGQLPDGELNNWLAWMGANRAKQLKAEGRENNLSQADIDELLALADGKEALFEQVRSEYNAINSAVLDVAQGAGLISAAQRSGFDEQYYVPFFRDIEADAGFEEFAAVYAPNSKKGIAGQKPKIQELKGGKQSTKDLLENIILRQSTMIDAALKNKAMLEVVENLDGTGMMDRITANEYSLLSENEQKRTVRMMVNGKQQRVVVSDPALLRALMAINDVSSRSLFNRMGRSAKRFLTTGVTLSPDFIFKNFVRDAAHAWMINKDDFTLGTDSIKGFKKAFTEDEAYRDLIFSGAAFQGGYIHGADPEAAAQQIRRALSKKGLTAKQIDSYMGSLIINSKKLFEVYRNFSDKVENANRLSTYEAALRSGKSRRQAAFEAKDLMDYSLKGNFALISSMIDFLPFFNARLQGLYKLARASAAGENDKVLKVLSANLAMKGLKVAAISLALAAWNEDDERYKELPDWDKDANWHFWAGESHWRVPKPFELGIMFGTLPERLFNFGSGTQSGGDLGRATASALFNTMALNPLPQFALPAIEVIVNKSFFKWTDIEGMGDEQRMPGDRYSAYTSDTAREIGKFFNISPKKIEHLVNGYSGTLGGYVLGMADIVSRQMMGIEKPETPISRYPVIKAFYGGDAPIGSTYYQNEFYKALDAANQAYGSYKRASEEQDSSRMMEVLEDNRDKLGVRIALNRVQRQVSALSKQAKMVNDSSMSPSEKREKLDAITRKKNAIYQSAYIGFNLREW